MSDVVICDICKAVTPHTWRRAWKELDEKRERGTPIDICVNCIGNIGLFDAVKKFNASC